MATDITPQDILKSLNSSIEVCDGEGLTQEYLAKRLRQKVDAKDMKYFAFQGRVRDERELEAHDVNLKAIVATLQWRGELKDKLDVSGSVKFDRSPEEQEFIRLVAREIGERVRKK